MICIFMWTNARINVCTAFFCMASAVLLLSARIQKSNPSNFCMDLVCQKDNMYVYTYHFDDANISISQIGRAMFARRIVVDSITRRSTPLLLLHNCWCCFCYTMNKKKKKKFKPNSNNRNNQLERIPLHKFLGEREREKKRNKRTEFNWKKGGGREQKCDPLSRYKFK